METGGSSRVARDAEEPPDAESVQPYTGLLAAIYSAPSRKRNAIVSELSVFVILAESIVSMCECGLRGGGRRAAGFEEMSSPIYGTRQLGIGSSVFLTPKSVTAHAGRSLPPQVLLLVWT